MQTDSEKPFTGELRLQGNMPLLKETSPRLLELLADAGIDAGAWQLPIFLCEELQSPNILPVFLSPQDLAATWEKSGRTKEELPEGITMMDLRMLVAQMQTEDNPWRIVQFVGSQEAYELVSELQGEGGADAKTAEGAAAVGGGAEEGAAADEVGADEDEEEADDGLYSS
mmetsp:Transcript_45643/g.126684  ORF Transcript_45643/g.126684 Transcript_45643/m.126684 type:complete len:170 (+) Transcript_45643:129-638(+)